MKEFIKLLDFRIKKNTIKKYKPFGDLKIYIYYNVSRYKVEMESFEYPTKRDRDNMLEELDAVFI